MPSPSSPGQEHGSPQLAATLTTVVEAIGVLRRASLPALSATLLTSVAQGLVPVLVAYVAKLIIDRLTMPDSDAADLWPLLAIEVLLSVVFVVARFVGIAAQELLRERVWQQTSLSMIAHSADLDLEFFETPQNYSLLAKAQREVGFRPMILTVTLLNAVQGFVTVVGFLGVLVAFQPFLALILLVAMVPSLFMAKESGHISFETQDLTTDAGRRAAYFDALLLSDTAAKEVRLYDLAPFIVHSRAAHADAMTALRIKAAIRKARGLAVADLVSLVFQYASLAFLLLETLRGQITVGSFVLFSGALAASRTQLGVAITNLGETYEHALFFRDLRHFFAVKPNIEANVGEPVTPPQFAITLEHVTFRYPGSDRDVLQDVTLDFRAGESTAIVGVNGAGKTTLVKVLTRLYDPSSGRVLIDGRDIRDLNVKGYRSLFGVIMQDFVKYQLSARENVTFAKLDVVDESRLWDAAHRSNLMDVIGRLPDGWNTSLGRAFDEAGTNLSGGQWQRVAIARALFRAAPILVLDEPTAALDAEAEAEVFAAYRELIAGKTSILISHRFNTVKLADRIIVFEEGRAVEDGNHAELMRLRGRYFEMFTAQAESYGIPTK